MTSFPAGLASVLTGASIHQLRRWRSSGLAVPEVHKSRPMLYSFRDVVALRTIVWLRSNISLQKIRTAFSNLDVLDFTEHPSQYQFATDGKTIAVADETGKAVDLVKRPGQVTLFTLEDVFNTFENRRHETVVDFRRPRRNLVVSAARMGGWPTAAGTRVTYDAIARLVDNRTIFIEDVPRYYPGVTAEAAADALSLSEQVIEAA